MAVSFQASAPGRVNLIGEHTDYNLGFVLPTVIPQTCRTSCTLRKDRQISVTSTNMPGQPATYQLGREEKPRSGQPRAWWHYIQGITWVLERNGQRTGGCDLRIESDIPLGSGLSSSAALSVSLLRVFQKAFGLDYDDLTLAKLARRSENEFIGAPVGILDPLACHLGRPDEALFIDTQSLEIERVGIPAGVELVVIHSGVAHEHAGGDYATRVRECQEACRALGVEHLRNCSVSDLPRINALPSPLSRRARHVITENQRVLDAVTALKTADLHRLGRLFDASHVSQRDDYQVSIPAIDQLVEIAQEHEAVLGARLTGGGFGGSIVALAKAGLGRQAAQEIAASYQSRTGHQPHVLVPPG
jgi:galactokinase